MNLVYISEGNGSAIQSQVFEYIKYLNDSNKFEKIYFLRLTREKNDHPEFKKGVEVFNVYNYGTYPFLEYLNLIELTKCLKKIRFDESDIIHVRSSYLAYLFLKAFKRTFDYGPRLLIDIRGADLEENLMKNQSFLKMKFKRYLILKVRKYLNREKLNFSVVSKELKEYVEKRFKIETVHVNPCFAPEIFNFDYGIRNEIRKNLGINKNEILIIFSSGSKNNWQKSDEIINHFSCNNKLLMLTKQTHQNINENVISKFVDYSEVHKYLCAADIGVIIRDKAIINKVASPIKFSEYVVCGLPVITDGNVDQINEFILDHNFGTILNLKILNQIDFKEILMDDRIQASKIGNKYYGITEIVSGYLDTYKKLCEIKSQDLLTSI